MRLSFGQFQIVVLVVFGAIAVVLALVFILVARQSRGSTEFEHVRDTAYRLRRRWLVFLIALLSSAVGISLFFLPYPSGAASHARARVRVIGGQFFWSLSPPHVRAGSEVQFDVTSVDVNHGFGIYNPQGQLLGSVQAMPGYTNRPDLTLNEPGSYLISCLEFCGVKHPQMSRQFEVTR